MAKMNGINANWITYFSVESKGIEMSNNRNIKLCDQSWEHNYCITWGTPVLCCSTLSA
jgi:hypothetical protein